MITPRPTTPFRALLTNRAFTALWIGQTISTVGDVLYGVALLWYVLDKTGSAFSAGLIAVAAMLGRLTGGAIAATLLDRVPARRVMLLSDGVRCTLTGTIGLLWLGELVPPLMILYAVACIGAIGGALFGPARAAAMPQIVPGERLVAANALDRLTAGLTDTLIFGVSGAIVAVLGPARSLTLDALTFLISFAAVWAARWAEAPTIAKTTHQPLVALWEGGHWVRDNPLARAVLLAQLIIAFAGGLFFAGIAPFLRRHFDGGAAIYGLQGAIFGVGLVLGAGLIAWKAPQRVGLLYACGIIVNGLGNSGFALSSSLGALLPAVFVAGLGNAAFATCEITLLQAYLPPALRGRIIALTITFATAFVLPAVALGGWLSDHADPRWIMLGASLAHIVVGVMLSLNRRLRTLRTTGGEQR
ncbi:MAG TPA: MFS transporter [Thermomicrobiales bacterium]|jgi:MFS family permease